MLVNKELYDKALDSAKVLAQEVGRLRGKLETISRIVDMIDRSTLESTKPYLDNIKRICEEAKNETS